MRFSCILCVIILIAIGICGGIYAFSGFNLLLFLCFYNATAYRCLLATGLVSALFTIYALLAFKPFRGLK